MTRHPDMERKAIKETVLGLIVKNRILLEEDLKCECEEKNIYKKVRLSVLRELEAEGHIKREPTLTDDGATVRYKYVTKSGSTVRYKYRVGPSPNDIPEWLRKELEKNNNLHPNRFYTITTTIKPC
jgi:hypothetical protein